MLLLVVGTHYVVPNVSTPKVACNSVCTCRITTARPSHPGLIIAITILSFLFYFLRNIELFYFLFIFYS